MMLAPPDTPGLLEAKAALEEAQRRADDRSVINRAQNLAESFRVSRDLLAEETNRAFREQRG